MFKQLAAILIILSIAWHILAEAAVYLSFKINQDYIETYLCENRNDPESECHGCCQLEKELKKQQDKKSEMPDHELKKVEIQYFPVSVDDLVLFPVYIEKPGTVLLVSRYSFGVNHIFHPPKGLLCDPVLS